MGNVEARAISQKKRLGKRKKKKEETRHIQASAPERSPPESSGEMTLLCVPDSH